ncbi:MAG TPA: hypothetical protein V6C65_33320, partial [Allocoleopsis sp.]
MPQSSSAPQPPHSPKKNSASLATIPPLNPVPSTIIDSFAATAISVTGLQKSYGKLAAVRS